MKYINHMRSRKGFFFLALLPLLGGCGSTTPSVYCDRNGDLASFSYDDSPYSSVLVEERAESLLKRVDAGETVFLFSSSQSCSSCLAYQDVMVKGFGMYGAQISLLEHFGTLSESAYQYDVALLKERYSDVDNGFDGKTPRLYMMDKEGSTRLNIYDHFQSATAFRSFLASSFALNGLTHFAVYENYVSFIKDKTIPSYLYDSSDTDAFTFYEETIRKKAAALQKTIAIVDYGSLSDEGKSSALAAFGLTSYEPVLSYEGASCKVKEKAAEAASLINAYCA
jgi:hypothetical protein